MKGIAYSILFVVISTIILGPLVESIQLVTEKARIDSVINNCGKLAIMTSSVNDKARDIEVEIDLDKFMDTFSDSLAGSLNLSIENSTSSDLSDSKVGLVRFKSNDGRYNDFTVNLNIKKDNPNICEVSVTSKYKFKTKHLIFVEEHVPTFTSFNLERKSRFVLDQIN